MTSFLNLLNVAYCEEFEFSGFMKYLIFLKQNCITSCINLIKRGNWPKSHIVKLNILHTIYD